VIANALSAYSAQREQPPAAISGTAFDVDRATHISELVERALGNASEEPFEDGTPSVLTRSLAFLLQKFANDACKALERSLESKEINDEIRDEILRFLGRVRHRPTHKYRLNLLQQHLYSASARTRFAAILGLASMNDPAGIPAALDALEREGSDRVRHTLGKLLDQLQTS